MKKSRYDWACPTCKGRRLKPIPPDRLQCLRCGAQMPQPPTGRVPLSVMLLLQRFFGRGAVLDYRYTLVIGALFGISFGLLAFGQGIYFGPSPATLRERAEASGEPPSPEVINRSKNFASSVTCREEIEPPGDAQGATAGFILKAQPHTALYNVFHFDGTRAQGRPDIAKPNRTVYANLTPGGYYLVVFDVVTEVPMQRIPVTVPSAGEGRLLLTCHSNPVISSNVCEWCLPPNGPELNFR